MIIVLLAAVLLGLFALARYLVRLFRTVPRSNKDFDAFQVDRTPDQ